MLKNENLEQLLKRSPKLKKLNISSCPHLTVKMFPFISYYCKELEEIICEDNFWLSNKFEWKLI